MRILSNNNGIALVTSLMFTVLALVISLALLTMITSSTKSSGAMKRYKTALDATYGGTEIVLKDLIAASITFAHNSSAYSGTPFNTYLQSNYLNAAGLNSYVSNCFKEKLTKPRAQWSSACSDVSTKSISDTRDISFNLNAASGSPFVVNTKIVDTMERKILVPDFVNMSTPTGKVIVLKPRTLTIACNTGDPETSSKGVVSGSTVVPVHYPCVYSIEIQGERVVPASQKLNPNEKANISVQYAY